VPSLLQRVLRRSTLERAAPRGRFAGLQFVDFAFWHSFAAKADWVRGEARLISSASAVLAKRSGTLDKSELGACRPAGPVQQPLTPEYRAASGHGVNWMRCRPDAMTVGQGVSTQPGLCEAGQTDQNGHDHRRSTPVSVQIDNRSWPPERRLAIEARAWASFWPKCFRFE